MNFFQWLQSLFSGTWFSGLPNPGLSSAAPAPSPPPPVPVRDSISPYAQLPEAPISRGERQDRAQRIATTVGTIFAGAESAGAPLAAARGAVEGKRQLTPVAERIDEHQQAEAEKSPESLIDRQIKHLEEKKASAAAALRKQEEGEAQIDPRSFNRDRAAAMDYDKQIGKLRKLKETLKPGSPRAEAYLATAEFIESAPPNKRYDLYVELNKMAADPAVKDGDLRREFLKKHMPEQAPVAVDPVVRRIKVYREKDGELRVAMVKNPAWLSQGDDLPPQHGKIYKGKEAEEILRTGLDLGAVRGEVTFDMDKKANITDAVKVYNSRNARLAFIDPIIAKEQRYVGSGTRSRSDDFTPPGQTVVLMDKDPANESRVDAGNGRQRAAAQAEETQRAMQEKQRETTAKVALQRQEMRMQAQEMRVEAQQAALNAQKNKLRAAAHAGPPHTVPTQTTPTTAAARRRAQQQQRNTD